MQLNSRQVNDPIKKWAKELNRYFPKEDIQTHEKMLNITHCQKMQKKMTVRYHLTPVRMAAIKSTKNNAGEGAEKREPSYIVGGNAN